MVLAVVTGLAGLLAGLVVGIVVGRIGARHELSEAYELLSAVGYDNKRLRRLLCAVGYDNKRLRRLLERELRS